MRTLPVAAVVSTVVHVAVVLAWLTRGESPAAPRIVAVAAPAPDTTFDVEFVDLSKARAAPSPGRARSRIASASRSVPRTPEIAEPGPEAAQPDDPPRPSLLTMRGTERRSEPVPARPPELPALPPGVIDDLLAKPPGLVPDLPGARIDVEIAAVRSRLRNPRYVANATADQLAADRLDLDALRGARSKVELVRQRDGSFTTHKDRFIARVDPDGKVHLTDKRNLEVYLQGLGIAGRFDVTDWAMRNAGMDPYASEKLKYLDRTRDQRAAIGQEYRRAQLAQSGVLMQRNIARLWASTPDVAARRQGLFELWDDCAESGTAELVAGGTAARTRVVNFIQVTMRGADAFTSAELARLNATRRSKATFAPYE